MPTRAGKPNDQKLPLSHGYSAVSWTWEQGSNRLRKAWETNVLPVLQKLTFGLVGTEMKERAAGSSQQARN